jgi:flavin reductase ActVB
MALDVREYRDALSKFPSGVTIVTTVDADGRPWGFTASAFASLSQDPPMVLVCLARSAECHPVFQAAEELAISILRPGHADIARLFATRGVDKFGGGGFHWLEDGHPVVSDALAVLRCRKARMVEGGDHSIILGEVWAAETSDGHPMLYFERDFRSIG